MGMGLILALWAVPRSRIPHEGEGEILLPSFGCGVGLDLHCGAVLVHVINPLRFVWVPS